MNNIRLHRNIIFSATDQAEIAELANNCTISLLRLHVQKNQLSYKVYKKKMYTFIVHLENGFLTATAAFLKSFASQIK